MGNIIKITIESTAGAGKSCVAFSIAKMLREHGLQAEIGGLELNDDYPGVQEQQWRDRLATVARRETVVKIETKYQRVDSLNNPVRNAGENNLNHET